MGRCRVRGVANDDRAPFTQGGGKSTFSSGLNTTPAGSDESAREARQ